MTGRADPATPALGERDPAVLAALPITGQAALVTTDQAAVPRLDQGARVMPARVGPATPDRVERVDPARLYAGSEPHAPGRA